MAEYLEKFGLATLAVFILFGVGLTSLYAFWSKWKKTTEEMNNLRTDLEKLIGNGSVDMEKLGAISERMGKSRIFKHAWVTFEATLIKDDRYSEVQIYNTQPFSTFLPFQQLFDQQLNAQSFMKAPSLITSMGLTFTFTFIVIGLGHLKPMPSGKIEGISELIEGLSAKFISSISALLVSIILTVAEDNLAQMLEKDYHKLSDLMDRKFQKQPPEYYLRSIEVGMRELNQTMKNIGIELAEAIRKAILETKEETRQEELGPVMKRLGEAIEKLSNQKSENLGEIISKAISEAMGGFGEGGNQFAEIGSAIEKMTAMMGQNAENSNQTAAQMEKLVLALENQVQESGKNSTAAVAQMQADVVPVMEEVKTHAKQQAETLIKMLTLMNQFWKTTVEPYQVQPKKRLDEHLKELRRNSF